MFCPECGEVMGPGPLDTRRARQGCDDRPAKSVGHWLHACVRAVFRNPKL